MLDLTQNIAGPSCTQLLGDMGATVWKIERPGTGDDARRWAPNVNGLGTAFLAHNRNKKSVCIELGTPQGQKLIRVLARNADVFVHSMRPSTAADRGFAYESLSKENDRLIHCAISAFGEVGPLRDLPGYDVLVQGFTGIMSVTGHPDQPPVRVGVSIIDNATGLWAFSGILAALLERAQTGRGSKITTSLTEVGISWVSMLMTNYLATGAVPAPLGSGAPLASPYEAYRTQDHWILIAAGNSRQFGEFCKAIGVMELAHEPKFASNELRVKHRKDLQASIERILTQRRTSEWIDVFRAASVPCSTIHSIDQVHSDEQVKALEMIVPAKDKNLPGFHFVDIPVSLNGARARLGPIPRLGEHTDEVLTLAGISDAELAQMRSAKVVG